MKTIFLAIFFTLWISGIHAQTGMPQELTCTERAFNFTFSLGSNWKFTGAKMGPVESNYYVPENFLNYRLKIKNPAPENYTLSEAQKKKTSLFNSKIFVLPKMDFQIPVYYTMPQLFYNQVSEK
jgi:hypothetical protein